MDTVILPLQTKSEIPHVLQSNLVKLERYYIVLILDIILFLI